MLSIFTCDLGKSYPLTYNTNTVHYQTLTFMSDENFPIPRLFLAATLTLYRWYGYNFGSTIPPKDLEKLSAVVNNVWITCSKGLLFKEERLVVSKSFECSVLLRSYGVHGTENILYSLYSYRLHLILKSKFNFDILLIKKKSRISRDEMRF